MKILLIVIDGLGDKPIPQLGNKTPLEAAKTLNLDFLAENGICGLISPFYFPYQKYPRSDTAHLALLGCDPKKYYLGRGVYEVAGIGMKLKKGDIAIRANFGTVDDNLKIVDRRAGRISQTDSLIKALSKIKEIEGVKFLVKKSYGHRAGLVLRGKGLSSMISDGDPHKPGVYVDKIIPLDKSKKSAFTAKVLNEYLERTHKILKECSLNRKRKLPANYLLVRGAGEMRNIPNFKLKAACIAGGGLYKGVGKILGMDLINVKGATGFPTTDLKAKFSAAKRALSGKYDFVFLHIKATDNLAEDGNFIGKKKFIEKIDRDIKSLLTLKNTLLAITADHSTCCALKRHCLEPVPVLFFGDGKDKVKSFSEKAFKKGKLGKFKQIKLMSKLIKYAKNN